MGYLGPSPSDEALKIGDDVILSSHINDGVIVNADINASAAIAMSKTTLVGGAGLTLSTNTLSVDADQSGQITSVGTLTGLTVSGSSVPQLTIGGTTPTIYLGDSGAEDTKLVFRGNATDVYLALDDSADKLLIGQGTTVGGDTRITIDPANGNTTFAGDVIIDADDKALVLGADQDASIWATDVGNVYIGSGQDYSLSSSDTEGWFNFKVGTSGESFLNIVGGEGGVSSLYMTADQADDNADRWRLQSKTNGHFTISTLSSGSYVEALTIEGDGTVQTVGALQPAGNVAIGGFVRATSFIQTGAGATGTTNAGNWQFVSKSGTGGTISANGGMGYFALGDNYTTSDAILQVRNDGNRGGHAHASGSSLFKASFNDGDAFTIDKSGNVVMGGSTGGSIFLNSAQGAKGGIYWGGVYGQATTKLVNIDNHAFQDVVQISFNNASWGTVMFELKFADEGGRGGVFTVTTQGYSGMTSLDTVTTHDELSNSNFGDNFQLAYMHTGNIKLQAKNYNSVGGMGLLVTVIGGNRSSDNDIGATWLR